MQDMFLVEKVKIRTILICLLFLVSTTSQSAPSNATVLTGKTCTQLNSKRISSEKLYTCVKRGSKKVWNSGTDLIPTEVVSFDATSTSRLIPFSFLATKGDSCIATLTYGIIGTSLKTFNPVQNLRTISSFEITPITGVVRLSIQCKYSGNASESIRIAIPTPSPTPTPTPTVSIKPSPTPTPTPSPTFSISPVTNFSGTDNISTIEFSFSPAQGNISASYYEIGIAYLKTASANQTLLSNYSDIEIYLNLGIRTLFSITPNQIREYLAGKSVTSQDRSVMFFVRGTYGDTKGDWSRGIYLTPAQINRGSGSTPTPTATPTSPPTPTPTVTPSPSPTTTPSLLVGKFYSGQDNDDVSWKWVAVEISNSSSNQILSHRSYDVLIGDSGGAIVDSSWEPSFPLLGPGQKAWYVATQFNNKSSSQVVFRKTYSTQPSPLSITEFPATSNVRLVTSTYYATRKAIGFSLKNNSSSRILSGSSTAFAVLFDANGVPVYAERGMIGKSVLPGGTAEVTVGDFTFNGSYASIQVIIGVVLD